MPEPSRRDFLLLRTERGSRAYDLSCERLYMQYLAAQESGPAEELSELCDRLDGDLRAEPEPRPQRAGAAALFDGLELDLSGVERLRIVDGDWLAHEGFRRGLQPVLERFRARGGRIEEALS